MAERKPKHEPVRVQTMEQLLRVVVDVVASKQPAPIELRDGRRVNISPEPRSLAIPANGVAFTPEEIAERRAIIQSLFGAWADIDGEEWKARIKESRGSIGPTTEHDR